MAYIGKQPVVGNFVKLDAITTSATATYNLLNGGVAYFPQTANNCIVSLNGVIQSPTSAYTISGSTIVFSDALTSSDTIDFILVLGDVLSIGTPSDGTITSAKLASGVSGLISWQSVQTTGFTAVAGRGYPCNTTSSAFTVTLPASPNVGDTIILLDYAGTFGTNAITLSPNGNKIEGGTLNRPLTTNREAVTLTYVDSTQGWVSSSASNYGSQSIDTPPPYSVDFLVIGGGGSGGGGLLSANEEGGGGGGAGGYRTSTQSVSVGTVITVTVGNGGASVNVNSNGNAGSASSISGSGLTTISSAGGGHGGGNSQVGGNGGSGGGAGAAPSGTRAGGSGNTPSTSPSQGNNGGSGTTGAQSGGGGGAGATGSTGAYIVGGNGGNGTASSITGSSVTRAGGGGGGSYTVGTGGTGGGGNGGNVNSSGVAGTANTGSGGGGIANTGSSQTTVSGAGGKGVVILSVPTASYSGTSTGSPTVTTSGSNTILQFTGSGTYTG